jgi:uncharacterized protein
MNFPPTSHRPWPVPDRPWTLAMNWNDLLFMHWPVPVRMLRPHVPPDLEIDTFESEGWLGITPFQMTNVHPRLVPALPRISEFPELNVRTCVHKDGKPGVWFFSLDAGNPLAVRAARWGFHLPYFDARMEVTKSNGAIHYFSMRTDRRGGPAELKARYRPEGPVFSSEPGTLEHWLTERYCLYAENRGTIYRGEIHHAKWPLQPASAEIEVNTMTQPLGIALSKNAPLLHYSPLLEVVGWMIEKT